MSRETENALLLLVGVSTLIISATGTFTRYVKPSLLPWLMASAVLLIVLALVSIVRDIRSGPQETEHGHRHRSGVLWLLIVPVALLGFVVPPALGPQTARPAVREVSTEVLRRPFPGAARATGTGARPARGAGPSGPGLGEHPGWATHHRHGLHHEGR